MKTILLPKPGINILAGSTNNLIQAAAAAKKKKGKIIFERQYVAADSSEASDGTKELFLG
jgi:hypothetical protein